MGNLWYRQPASKWDEAMPIGNGKIGVMIFGNPKQDTVQLNEESLWSALYTDRNNKDAPLYLSKIRELLAAGEITKAEALVKYAMTGIPRNETVYQTVGNLCIETEHKNYTNYKRELDLACAVAKVQYDCGGVTFQRELFVSAVENALVIRFTANRPGKISLSSNLLREGMLNFLTPFRSQDCAVSGMEGGTGIKFCAMQKMKAVGGSVQKIGEYLIAENVDEVLLFTAVTTSFRETEYRKKTEETLAKAMAKSYEELLDEHIAEYQSYFNRMYFDLAYDRSLDELPTDERLKRFSSGESDNGLIMQYFEFGRYLLISSSRPGSLPANLQGIWNNELNPPWGSKYTININTEMNYWLAENCNLSDCHTPLFEHLKRMRENGQQTARVMYHARGMAAHHNTDIWGDTAPQDLWMPATIWLMSVAWLCTHLWQHYEYTEDNAFLREYYPIIHDATLFFIDYLIEDSKGRLIVCPTVSPENSYIHPETGEAAYISAGCTMDSQILRDLFQICIRSSKILDIEDGLSDQINKLLPKLPKTEIHSNGTIMEWLEEYEELEVGHRHISHLYGLYPSEQISPVETPELASAARKTLERRLSHGGGHTGWSRAWIINFWARLLDGEKAWENIRLLLSKSTLPSLLDNHPPFQIDGNFGAAAGIAEMLLQSVHKKIILLPALPWEWKDGSMSGLKAKGNITVSMRWQQGELAELCLQAREEKQVRLMYHGIERQVTLKQGDNYIPIERLK